MIDFNEMDRRLQEALDKETPESLNKYFSELKQRVALYAYMNDNDFEEAEFDCCTPDHATIKLCYQKSAYSYTLNDNEIRPSTDEYRSVA